MTYEAVRHPWIEARKHHKPVQVVDALPTNSHINRVNSWLAVKITTGVGTMYCAYIFGLIALISLNNAIKDGTSTLISWIAQTFLQLVLLSIILVGQNVSAITSDKRSADTYKDAEAILSQTVEIQKQLQVQEEKINEVLIKLG